MTRIIPMLLAFAALAAPAVSLAGDGAGNREERMAKLEARVGKYAEKCKVANAPARCAQVKQKLGARIDKIQARITARLAAINQRCSVPAPGKGCAKKGERAALLLQQVLSRLSALERRL